MTVEINELEDLLQLAKNLNARMRRRIQFNEEASKGAKKENPRIANYERNKEDCVPL